MTWYFRVKNNEFDDLFPQVKVTEFKKLPIKIISKVEQQPFIEKVDQIITLKKSGKDTTDLEREIDKMVYELYGLTDEEIKIVEESVNK